MRRNRQRVSGGGTSSRIDRMPPIWAADWRHELPCLWRKTFDYMLTWKLSNEGYNPYCERPNNVDITSSHET
jgi:hypothetical protein